MDQSQFLQAFVEEAYEILQEMENALLRLDINLLTSDVDETASAKPLNNFNQSMLDIINQIFRCVHTLKSNSAMFGYNKLSKLNHTIENILEPVRSAKKIISAKQVTLMLKSVDCMRNIIQDIKKKKKTVNESCAELLTRAFEQSLEELNDQSKEQPKESSKKSVHEEKLKEKPKDQSTEKSTEKPLNNSTLERSKILSQLQTASVNNTTLRVSSEKIDKLLNLIGELVISQSILKQISQDSGIEKIPAFQKSFAQLENHSSQLQDSIMQIRMLPIAAAFTRLPRVVRDLAEKSGKKINLVITGEYTEIDKNMLEKIADPLLHLIRNSVDHGIELPSIREQKGKPPEGTIELTAFQQEGKIVIAIKDDGCGIDVEKIKKRAIELKLIGKEEKLGEQDLYQLIVKPGFSTADKITNISGRGVGLDVVNKSVQALGGQIEIESVPNQGTTFFLRMPLTLAILDCQLVHLGEYMYAIPMISIVEIIEIDNTCIKQLGKHAHLYHLRDDYIPMIYLKEILKINKMIGEVADGYLIVVNVEDELYGLVVTDLSTQQQMVMKNLENNYDKFHGILGATILGNGQVSFILDANELIDIAYHDIKKNEVEQFKLEENTHQAYNNRKQNDLESTRASIREMPPQENLRHLIKKEMQCLTFKMADEEYGIDILNVQEILPLLNITPLPNAPEYVIGVMNLRGEIIPVIDLCCAFGLGDFLESANTVIITLRVMDDHRKKIIGIIVDEVLETYSITDENLKPIPKSIHNDLVSHALGLITVDSKMITLLSISIAEYATERRSI